MNKKEALDAMKSGKRITHPDLKKIRGINWIMCVPSLPNKLIFSDSIICSESYFLDKHNMLPEYGYIEYHEEYKNDPLSYFMFMYNMWMEEVCKEVFKNANCGWKHLWDKWIELRNIYGYDGAIARYLCELSEDYAATLVKFALSKYDGRKRI